MPTVASPSKVELPRLRAAFFTWRDLGHPWAGGSEVFAHEIGKRLVERGHAVAYITARYPGADRWGVYDGGVVWRRGGRYGVYPAAAWTYLTKVRAWNPDVVVDVHNGIPFFTPLYVRRPRVSVFLHLHQPVFDLELSKPVAFVGRLVERYALRLLYRRERFVTISDSSKASLGTLGPDLRRISVVHPGIDLTPTSAPPAEKSGHPEIVYLGRLQFYKSVDHLIRAFASLTSDLPDARLRIIGRGEARLMLEDLVKQLGIAGRVTFEGFVSEDDKIRALQQAWVVVQPSLTEGWGIGCIEAAAAGTPVVAADVPGLRDSVRDGETGILYPHGDVAALADSLRGVLRDASLRERLGAAGRDWSARFHWDASTDAFERVLLEATNR